MKRIICCLDGTWNNAELAGPRTNVWKIAAAIADRDASGVRQITHYVRGIASQAGETIQFVKGAIGYGVADQIATAYANLSADYQPGDEVFIFGFSRGAFEARSLGAFLTQFGISNGSDPEFFAKAWALYELPKAERPADAIELIRAAARAPIRIKCLGVWDTVGNIGNPFFSSRISRRFDFHDLRLTDAIEVGLHALSVDEARGPFRPTFWTLPKGQKPPADQHIEQVWFPGCHADVGGGYRETGLSDISLNWMAQRVQAYTGLTFVQQGQSPELDKKCLALTTRPDPYAAQHSETTGAIFGWSRVLPYIRLIEQSSDAIPPLRRKLLGHLRTSHVPEGEYVVGESVHGSVRQRYGSQVSVLEAGQSRMMVYKPRNLAAILPEAPAKSGLLDAKPVKPRRVKIFTVHGTFAHKADWDNWDKLIGPRRPTEEYFVNRLHKLLTDKGIQFEQADHTQYEWSGGNSHDERWTAAIGLKRIIEEEIRKHPAGYYDAVYIVAHSHGGTISRLAMNLWDRPYDYYDPIGGSPGTDLDKHYENDDECPHCLRERNGRIRWNTVPRPDGVITFGSPFVTFEPRPGGLKAAQIGVWVWRALALLPLAALYIPAVRASVLGGLESLPFVDRLGTQGGSGKILLPLLLYWLVAIQLSRIVVELVGRWFPKSTFHLSVAMAARVFKLVALAALVTFYYQAMSHGWDHTLARFPKDALQRWQTYLIYATPLALYWVVAFRLPGRWLARLRTAVTDLKEKLPLKYDPREEKPVRYLSYHTPGDEAGSGLRIFGFMTWMVQTLGLAAAAVLAIGTLLFIAVAVEGIAYKFNSPSGGITTALGMSPWEPSQASKFVAYHDKLTAYPAFVWNWLTSNNAGNSAIYFNLGDVPIERRADVAWYTPIALLVSIGIVFVGLMPIILAALTLAYVANIWLRGSGLVFGSEKHTWTLANRIAVTRRANANTDLRVVNITPEAWWRGEVAHCYYYRSMKVTEDVANYIADWSRHKPSKLPPVGPWLSKLASWLVVSFAVLSIFVMAVAFASNMEINRRKMNEQKALETPKGATIGAEQPKPATTPARECKTDYIEVTFDLPVDHTMEDKLLFPIQKQHWEPAVAAAFGAEWANLTRNLRSREVCDYNSSRTLLNCKFAAMPCKAASAAGSTQPTPVPAAPVTAAPIAPPAPPALTTPVEPTR